MKRQITKITAITAVLALALAVGSAAYLGTAPQSHASGGPTDATFPMPQLYGVAPPALTAEQARGRTGWDFHSGRNGAVKCPKAVGWDGTRFEAQEAEIRTDGPPGKRLISVPVRISANQHCGSHTVYYETRDTESGHRADHGKDYEHTQGSVVIPDGQTVGLAQVWVKGDMVIEPDEDFDIVITGMKWNNADYQSHRYYDNAPLIKDWGKQSAESSAASPRRQIAVIPSLQSNRVTLKSLHQTGDGWIPQSQVPKHPLPAVIYVRSDEARNGTKTYEGEKLSVRISVDFRDCHEELRANWSTAESAYEASHNHGDYVKKTGNLKFNHPNGGPAPHNILKIQTLTDNIREDAEKVHLDISNVRGGCKARFLRAGEERQTMHIHDASPADAPMESAIPAGNVTATGNYTTDGNNLVFQVNLSHHLDEELAIGYDVVSRYNEQDLRWEAQPGKHFVQQVGERLVWDARDNEQKTIKVRTLKRKIPQAQLVQSVQLRLRIISGPGKLSSNQTIGLIYDRQHTGKKSMSGGPQQYNPQPTPTPQPTAIAPTPTPAPTATPDPNALQPVNALSWGTSEFVVTEDAGIVKVPFHVPGYLSDGGGIQFYLSTEPVANTSLPSTTLPAASLPSDNSPLDLGVVESPLGQESQVEHLPEIYGKAFYEGHKEFGIKVIAPRDGEVEGDEVLYINVVNVVRSDVRWQGEKSVRLVIKNADTSPGIRASLSWPTNDQTVIPDGKGGVNIIEGNGTRKVWALIKFDPPLPAGTHKFKLRKESCVGQCEGMDPFARVPFGRFMTLNRIEQIPVWMDVYGDEVKSNDNLRYVYLSVDSVESDVDLFFIRPGDRSNSYDHRARMNKYDRNGKLEAYGDIVAYAKLVEDDHEASVSLLPPAPATEGQVLEWTVQRHGNLSELRTVQYETRGGSATADKDYKPASGELTIPAGESAGKIRVRTKLDLFDEGTETIEMHISGAGNVLKSTAEGSVIDAGSQKDNLKMELGPAELTGDGTMIRVPVYVTLSKLVRDAKQKNYFQWGVSDDESFGDVSMPAVVPLERTLLGYITMKNG